MFLNDEIIKEHLVHILIFLVCSKNLVMSVPTCNTGM